MDKQKLREQLEELHAELLQVESVDDNDRDLLQRLTQDVQLILEREDHQTEHYGHLSDRLAEAIAQLEASHPKTTTMMREAMARLALLGI